MPAYNEKAIIAETIRQWHEVVVKTGPDSRLIIFNDGSKDNTYEIISQLKDTYPQLKIVNKPNSGHGPTCTFAYNYCIKSEAEYIFQTDSDGQTSPDDFWQLWHQRNEYDFLIGFRYHRQDGMFRIWVSYILKFLVWLIFGEKVKDPNTPFKLMNKNKLIPIMEIIPKELFLSNVMISMLVIKRKEKVLWLPISFKPRQKGLNSIKFKRIINIGLKSIGDFYRIKKKLKSI